MNKKLETKIKNLPRTPGIYKYLNKNGEIIYVGKAVDLKSRVGSYFAVTLDPGSKTQALVSEIADLEIIQTETEIEALVLEAALIKDSRPYYNINLKDNKSFLYIVIRPQRVKIDGRVRTISRIMAARKKDLKKSDIYFGPYPSSRTTRSVIRTIRRVFPYRDCSDSKFTRHQKLESPCLYGHISLCSAPCIYNRDKDIKEYQKNINKIKRFLEGKTSILLRDINKMMKQASKNRNYELAAYYRDTLDRFNYVRQRFHTPREYMDNPYLVFELAEKAMKELEEEIPNLKDIPERIECYDISTISGKDAVGSMVVALMGRIDNSEYRRFRIKRKSSPDDTYMMKEVLDRRFKREVSKAKNVKKWGLPDLVVVDGGKGQVSAALEVVEKYGIDIPIVGLAKKFENVVFRDGNKFIEKSLPENGEALKILIKLRDEAHRFAQDYHHHLRKKSITE